jgi:hypothetical protein
MDGAQNRKPGVDELVPPFHPPRLPRDPALRAFAKLLVALVRCGYAAVAASFLEEATAAGKRERTGEPVAIDSRLCEACSIAAERYANECQAVILESRCHESPSLVVDLRRWRIRFQEREIPTSGPAGLTPQAVVALAALAKHAPEPLSMDELGLEMERLAHLGGLPNTQSGEGLMRKYILRKIRGPFVSAGIDRKIVDALFELPRNGRLRLTLAEHEIRIEEAANTVRARLRRRPGEPAP